MHFAWPLIMEDLENEIWKSTISKIIKEKIKNRWDLMQKYSDWDTITSLLIEKKIWKDIVDIVYETFKVNYSSVIKKIFKWEFETWLLLWLESETWWEWWNSWWEIDLSDLFWIDDDNSSSTSSSSSWWNDDIEKKLEWYDKNIIKKVDDTLNKYFDWVIFNTFSEEGYYFKDEIEEWSWVYNIWW